MYELDQGDLGEHFAFCEADVCVVCMFVYQFNDGHAVIAHD
jgi:hypothetical protein